MPYLAISARFPLGTFLGHEATGQSSSFPDTARLHAALVHSAGTGSTAVEVGGDLRLSPHSVAALQWLEEHPPAVLGVPATHAVASGGGALAYRDDGVLEKRGKQARIRKAPKHQSGAVAVGGEFWWGWEEEIPVELMATIEALCRDVSCLGESDAPVILSAHEATSVQFPQTHQRASCQRAFPSPGGLPVRTPMVGRLAALEEDYEEARPAKSPTVSRDKYSLSERAASFKPTAARLSTVDYRPIQTEAGFAPWTCGWLLHTDDRIHRHHVVRYAAGLHRTLTRLLGMDSLPVLTGAYPKEAPRPANRIAIHYVSPDMPTQRPMEHGAFVVLVPKSASAEETAVVAALVQSVSRIYLGVLGSRSIGKAEEIDANAFWPAPDRDSIRVWQPAVPLVPEANRPRGWSLDDVALLSLAHVLRDDLDVDAQPGESLRKARVRHVRALGAWSGGARKVADSRVERYVHKAPKHLVVQPYNTLVYTAGLVPDQAAWGLGQSRHLGGGFMVPIDLSPEMVGNLMGQSRC